MQFHRTALLVVTALLANLAFSSDCAAAATEQAAYFSESPEATIAEISAEAAYDCVTSIPFQSAYSTKLIHSLKAWIQLESQVDYINSPAAGYLW